MKNVWISGLILLGSLSAAAQQADSARTQGGSVDVYYSMINGVTDEVDNTNWDISFEIKGFMSGIHVNEAAGAMLYITPYAVSSWSDFDSTGKDNWPVSHNGNSNWSEGAFNTNSTGDFDLGWGSYDINTHSVLGDSIYLLKTRGGAWKKIYIKSLANSVYTFVYANPDGSSEKTAQITKSEYNTVNFAYYNVDAEAALNREPNTNSWDIVFTKYLLAVPAGPVWQHYPVSGVKTNKGIQSAQRNNVVVSNSDTNSLNWNDDISEIGSDWKSWNGSAYDITANQSFFIRSGQGQVWKLYFTGFVGADKGNFYFVKENLSGSVSVADLNNKVSANVYPNPAQGQFQISLPQEFELKGVRVLDHSGRILRSWHGGQYFDLTGLVPGMYYVHILGQNETDIQTLFVH